MPIRRSSSPSIPSTQHETVKLLLDLGASIDARDSDGRTLLMVAIASDQIYGRANGVSSIERHVPPRLQPGREDWELRNIDTVRLLVERKADLALVDGDGRTALHYAAASDYHEPVARVLLAGGAPTAARDNRGRTPLDIAYAAKLVRLPQILAAASGRAGRR